MSVTGFGCFPALAKWFFRPIYLCYLLIVYEQDRLIDTIQIKIYNNMLGQIQHVCPFKCCRSQLNLPITTVSAHISKFRSEYV